MAPGAGILAAVSGGPDSMAQLHVLSLLAPRHDFQLFACGIDHGLRESAAAELSLAERAAATWGVPFQRRAVRIAPGGNIQARARQARYEALRASARECGAEVIAIAHHRDDRAETVLLRLLRGAGPRGLAVMPPRCGDLLRPMIHATRRDVELHLERHGIAACQDPSNQDPRFLRSRVRHELIPMLTELSPGAVNHLASLAEQLCEQRAARERQGGENPGEDAFHAALDASVAGVPLNREQAAQLRSATNRLRRPPPADAADSSPAHSSPAQVRMPSSPLYVPLSQERALTLDPHTGAPRIVPSAPGRRATRSSG